MPGLTGFEIEVSHPWPYQKAKIEVTYGQRLNEECLEKHEYNYKTIKSSKEI